MKTAWVVLTISAGTDFVISFGTALSTAMVAADQVKLPNEAVWLLATIGGLVAGARTVQQALKATLGDQSIAQLKQ